MYRTPSYVPGGVLIVSISDVEEPGDIRTPDDGA